MGCNQSTEAQAWLKYSKGIQDEGAEGIEGGRGGEIERNKQAHIKPVSFFFFFSLLPSFPLSLPLSHHYSSIRS